MKTTFLIPSLLAMALATACASSSAPLSSTPDAGGGAGAAGAGAAGAGSAGAGAVDSGSAGQPHDATVEPANVDVGVGADADPTCLGQTVPTTHGETTYNCALPQPCDVVVYQGLDGPGSYPAAATITLPAAQCALRLLRDATSSHIKLNHLNSEGYDDTDLWVQRDGSVIFERHYRLDLGGPDYGPRRFRGKPKAYFDACLLETDPKTVYECLTSWFVDGACFPAGDLPCAP